jgi:carbon monoxide dehydrogenase subunit G
LERLLAINLKKEYSLDLPRQEVWDAIITPEILAEILPNCKSLEPTGENEFVANIEIKVGPVTGKYKSNLSLFDLDPPSGYRFKVSGIGVKGTMSGEGEIKLVESEDGTIFIFNAEGNVSGIIARFGQRFIEAAGKKLMDQGFEKLKQKVTVPV